MNKLEAFRTLREAAEHGGSVAYENRLLRGDVSINQEISEAFSVLGESGDVIEAKVNGKSVAHPSFPQDGTVNFVVRAPAAFLESVAELVQRHPVEPPPGLFVFDQGADQLLPAYYDAVSLAKILKGLAMHTEPRSVKIYAKSSLDIILNYEVRDLERINGVDEMATKLQSVPDASPEVKRLEDVYREFFIQAVYDVTAGVTKERRFAHLILHFDECLFRFRQSFRIFSDEGNKAIERYEEKRAGIITALNGVLGGMQASLIGVPLAGFLALKEMKPGGGQISFENICIATAVIVIGLLLLALSFSQGRTLGAIHTQFSQLHTDIEGSGAVLTKTRNSLTSMSDHYTWVLRLLRGVRGVIIIFIIAGAVFPFIRLNQPIPETPPSQTK